MRRCVAVAFCVAPFSGLAVVSASPAATADETGPIVVVAATTAPPKADRPLVDRLEATGHVVQVVDDNKSTPSTVATFDDAALVVVTGSASPAAVKGKLAHVSAPMLVTEPQSYDDMLMSIGPQGVVPAGRDVTIVAPGHRLAAGQSGIVRVFTTGIAMGHGSPTPGSEVVATVRGPRARSVPSCT